MMESPVTFITGYGWNAYGSFREFRLVTHNVYLNHLFNIGTVGLTLFLAIISSVFATTRNAINGLSGEARSFAVSAIFGFFALCVSMFFVEVYMAGILIWAFIGLILRIAVDAHSENTQLENRADSSDVSGAA
jgi:O-antigen ligase